MFPTSLSLSLSSNQPFPPSPRSPYCSLPKTYTVASGGGGGEECVTATGASTIPAHNSRVIHSSHPSRHYGFVFVICLLMPAHAIPITSVPYRNGLAEHKWNLWQRYSHGASSRVGSPISLLSACYQALYLPTAYSLQSRIATVLHSQAHQRCDLLYTLDVSLLASSLDHLVLPQQRFLLLARLPSTYQVNY